MNKNDFIFIKTFFRKKQNYLNTIMLTILFVFISILSCYYYTTKNYLENDIKNGITYKRLYVEIANDDSKEVSRKKLEKIDHIVSVINETSYFNGIHSKELATKYTDGIVEIYAANNNSLPKIIKGSNFPNNDGNYLICPQNFYPNGSETSVKELTSEAKFDLDDYIGKNIKFYYPDLYTNRIYEADLILVGLYENNKTNIDESTCYTTENTMHEIFFNQNKNDKDFDESMYTSFFIQVDDIKNINKVIKSIEELKYDYQYVSTINYDYFNNIFFNTKIIVVILFFIITILIALIIYKQFKDNYNYYKLLNYTGYTSRNIIHINLISSLLLLSISIFLSVLVSLVIYILVNNYLIKNPFFMNKWNIIYNISLLYEIIITVIILMLIISKLLSKRI